jgi:hypothetical protein
VEPFVKVVLLCSSVALAVVVAACPAPKVDGEGEGEGGAAGEGEGEGAACGTDVLLGSLKVGANYVLAGGQGLPPDILAIGLSDQGTGTVELIGLKNDLHVEDLGTYPGTVPAIPPVLFDALAPADSNLDRTSAVFPSFLVVDGAKIATGYTRLSDQGGSLGSFDSSTPTTAPTYLDAPSNFAAAARGGTLFVEAAGLGTVDSGLGVYTNASGTAALFSALGASALGSGNLVVTKSGSLVVGRFIDPDGVLADGKNELFAIASSKVDAISAGTDTFDFETATPFFSGTLNGAAWGTSAFHDGMAQIAVDASFTGIAVSHTALADSGTSVTASTPDDVVTGGSAACTTISFLATSGEDLLVGVQDAAGHRVIQIHAK